MSTFQPHFNQQERLYSEAIMKYWTNFAKTGNPKAPWRETFLNMEPQDWRYYDVDWPEFNPINQSYLHLGITPIVSHRYRYKYMRFWNHELPIEYSKQMQLAPLPPSQPKAGVLPPPFIDYTTKYPPVLMRRTTTSGGIIEGHVNLFPMQHRPTKHDDPFKKLHRKLNPDAVSVMVNSPSGIDSVPPREFHQNKGEEVETYDIFKSESTLTMLIGIVLLFLIFNIFVIIGFFVRRQITKRNLNRKYSQNMFDAMTDEKRSKYNETDDSYIMDIIRRNESNTYEAIKANRLSGGKGFILSRQLSSSTVDAHTKVTDWISQDMCSSIGSKNSERTDVDHMNCQMKPDKVNVAVDATPAGRGGSVLRQEPIELMKARSSDYGFTKDVIICQEAEVDPILEAAPLRFETPQNDMINHKHSNSDPSQMISYYGQQNETVTSFIDDINVTSRDEEIRTPLTPEESLLGIQRRNFPKVLPDYLPDADANEETYLDKSYKRLSLPPQYFLMQSPVNKDFNKIPPAPPPRISSTLGRRPSKNNNRTSTFMTSPIKFADEPPVFMEPPTQVNTISVGSLVPKHNKPEAIYMSMRRMNSIQENQKSAPEEYENKEIPDEVTTHVNGLTRQNSSNSDSSTASSTGTIKKVK